MYYVLGNHDRRANETRLKAALAEAGLIHVGGTWRQVTVRDAPLILAGNELPWYKPAADLSDCPADERDRPADCGSCSPIRPTSSTGRKRTMST